MFITFEGIEGCGKSTQVGRLADRLDDLEVPYTLTLEPGGTKIGQNIRQILLDSRNQDLSPLAELFLYAADRAQHVVEVVKPALEQGKWVLCDRFSDATVAYQGFARRQDMDLITLINRKVCRGIEPDVTFLLDCPVEIGLRRALSRNKRNHIEAQGRFEREKEAFHQAVREGYLTLAKEESKRFVIVDATLPVNVLEVLIWEQLRPLLTRSSG